MKNLELSTGIEPMTSRTPISTELRELLESKVMGSIPVEESDFSLMSC